MSLAVTDVGSGHPILLVHGQPGSRADWSRLIPLLAGDHRVLAVDRPGYGESGGEAVGLLENAQPARAPPRGSLGARGDDRRPLARRRDRARNGRAVAGRRRTRADRNGRRRRHGRPARSPARDSARELARRDGRALGGARAAAVRRRSRRLRDRRLGLARRARASRESSGRCCASATCSRPGSTRSWCRRPWSSAAVTGS